MSTVDERASSAMDAIAVAAERVASEVRRRRGHPGLTFVLAIDGGSAAGKTVLGQRLAGDLNAVVVHADDFYAAEVSPREWSARSPADRLRDVIDWRPRHHRRRHL